jgi:hypothetical protein
MIKRSAALVVLSLLAAGCKPEAAPPPPPVEEPVRQGPWAVEVWDWNGFRMRMDAADARSVLRTLCGVRRIEEGDRAQARPPDPLTKYLRCAKSGVHVVDCPVDIEIRTYDGRLSELLATCSFGGDEGALRAWKHKIIKALDLRYGAEHIPKVWAEAGLYWRTDESLEVALWDLEAERNLKPQRIVLRYVDVHAEELRRAEESSLEHREVEAASKKL